ncbi:MAG: UDP-N-acetylmuramoyl-L-alanine--D-glutamate ligase [Phycisphaeraceae bacterium]|nr:UDP-N-acetylmuramoyl-L-alanine--D-glutamate ligase [Phycisphaeraceae bacterium]
MDRAMRDLSGKRVTVMGLGRFGGGIGVTRYLVSRGADVLVTDLEPAEKLAASVERIGDLVASGRVTLRLGEHNVSDFTTCDCVVANPAVPRPWENRYLRAAGAAAVPILTEIELALAEIPGDACVVAITGSAGKSTTSALIHHILSELGQRVHLGGNIGGSLLESIAEIRDTDTVVLELSSFQLHWIGAAASAARFRVAVITNIEANHLDWHGTFEHYRSSKLVLLGRQREGDTAILGPGLKDCTTARGVRRIDIPEGATVSGLLIPGAHNELNAAVAIEACRAVVESRHRGLFDENRAIAAARTFAGLPHRLHHVGTIGGIRFYDDSKSTTPHATLLALGAFPIERETGRIHLIVGGYDKGQDLAPLVLSTMDVKGLYTIGVTGERIASAAGAGCHPNGRVYPCGTLDRAIATIAERAIEGDVVLLSPGCASWDQFENYEQRGSVYASLVRAIFGEDVTT